MMDMFTIILIFLLFSFSSKPVTIDLDKNIKLPESVAELDHKESIKLVLSLTSLTLEDEIIANIKDGKIVGLDPLKLKESNLYKKLKLYREQTDESIQDEEAKKRLLGLLKQDVVFDYMPYIRDPFVRQLFWTNLIRRSEGGGTLVWRSETIRETGRMVCENW